MIFILIGVLSLVVIAEAIYFKRAIDKLHVKPIPAAVISPLPTPVPLPEPSPVRIGTRDAFSILYGVR